jgi:hypothetical protein
VEALDGFDFRLARQPGLARFRSVLPQRGAVSGVLRLIDRDLCDDGLAQVIG